MNIKAFYLAPAITAFVTTTAFCDPPTALATLYRFKGGRDIGFDESGVILANGMLYGTALIGGDPKCSEEGCGGVFAVNPITGEETVVHRFTLKGDGGEPNRLTYVNGFLYGTFLYSGTLGYGSLFKVDPQTGHLTELYYMQGGTLGAFPKAGMVYHDGAFYGTTDQIYAVGNIFVDGTVFKFEKRGRVWSNPHVFSAPSDGETPGAIIYQNGILYGTTEFGGGDCLHGVTCGTVYKVDLSTNTESIVYRFASVKDGQEPNSLLYDHGFLYGTTQVGGTSDFGTVFRIDPTTGVKTTLYNFQGGNDARHPNGLMHHDGALYGTSGWNQGDCSAIGDACGTVFKVDSKTGKERVLYNFTGGSDGGLPQGGVVYWNGAFYGATQIGGKVGKNKTDCGDLGCGTVFKLTP
jgi:uncharacterized repeat protein (TIGR03803 family)